MKKMRYILGVALTVGTAAISTPAHAGCCWGFGIPFLSFGLGLGAGYALSYPRYTYVCPQPAYYYYPPPAAYSYAPPPRYIAPANYVPPAPVVESAPVVTPAPVWVPSTPGAGHWVPDPQPYSYAAVVVVVRPAPPYVPPASAPAYTVYR